MNIEPNNLYCGDAYELIKSIPDKSVDLVIIDPPYELCVGGKGHGALAERCDSRNKQIYSLSKERKEYIDYYNNHGTDAESVRLRHHADKVEQRQSLKFISTGISNDILDELVRVMKKINIYIWCSRLQLRQLLDYFGDLNCNLDLITWHKKNAIPTCNNSYLSDTEYCVFARAKGVKIYGSVESKRKYYITGCNLVDKQNYKHPTIKPLNIIKNLIINSSNENDIVLDCFMGSGTTCVGAKELNRRYIGIEINPEFYKIAKDRLNGINANGQTSIFTDFNNI